MNILVTGGAGFIGSCVTRYLVKGGDKRLLQSPDVKVAVVDNLSNGFEHNLADLQDHPNFLGLFKIDLKDREKLARLFSKGGFDLCYHLAASISVQKSIDDPESAYLGDVVATFNLLEECRKYKTRVVYVSTCMVYAPAASNLIDEFHPVQCASPYAASKISCEKLVESYHHTYGLWTLILRPFNTYGPGQRFDGEGGVIVKFLNQKMADGEITVYGDGLQTRDFMYVTDCARFIAQSGLELGLDGLVLNAGTGRDITIREVAELVASDGTTIRHLPHPHPQSEKKKLCCNYTLAYQLLGWLPLIGLEEGLLLTASWLESELIKGKESGIGLHNGAN